MFEINLDDLAGGELGEQFQAASKKVVENLLDPNTPYKNKRSITIKLVFEQNEERNDVAVGVSVETKLAPRTPMRTNLAIGKDLRTLDEELRANAIHMTTLSSLVDYIKAGIDSMAEHMLVQVVSPTEVSLISMLNGDRKRECLAEVHADVPEFTYGKFMDSEAFLIGIRSKFIQNDGAEALLRFAGTVQSGTVAKYGDDGISQSATVNKGVVGKETELVPNPVKLRPYRTFTEVQQPESEFVFRMKDYDNSVACAVFEADGGAWKCQAMKNIKLYLETELADLPQFTVIS